MTIAIALKVGDGIVLGADSAATVTGPAGVNVYTNAEKVFNLVKGLPIGGVFFGLGGLQGRSVSSVIKDLRTELSDSQSPRYLNPASYTIEEAATQVREFLYEERYRREFPVRVPDPATGGERDHFEVMGIMVAGYSAGSTQSELWLVEVDSNGVCGPPVCSIRPDVPVTLQVGAQKEAVMRLLGGWSPRILDGMIKSGMDPNAARQFLTSQPMEPLISPAMPLQDAIDLVDFLIKVTAGFVRFAPGHSTVAEPIDLAAITRHEKFRWIRRKHYFSPELNPPMPTG